LITATDFIKLPYTPDLTQSGIEYATRSLPYTYNRMSGSLYSRLRRIVGGVAVELSLRRYLGEQNIPFDVKGATPFTEPDKYDVALGGHRCDLKTFVTSKRNQISAVRANPDLILRAPALIPSDQFVSESRSDQDIYIFAFLLGLTTNSPEDIQKAQEARQPLYLVHVPPETWSRPAAWVPLGEIVMKSECTFPIMIEIGGQDGERDFITRTVRLDPLKRMELPADFFSITYIHVDQIPNARIGLHPADRGETHLIAPLEWGNIWIYGFETWLAGWIAHEEFRRKSSTIVAGSRVFQYSKTQTKNHSVPVTDLRPLVDLFARVRAWEAGQR
jgi:hypothetical protein